jgi:hypothetical protein
VYSALVGESEFDINSLSDGPQSADAAVFERVLGVPIYLVTPGEIQLLRPRIDEVLDREGSDLLFRKIHDALHAGPSGEPIVSAAATRGAIYIVRDPRDVAVSFAHHQSQSTDDASRLLSRAAVRAKAGLGPRMIHRLLGYPLLPQYLGGWSEHVVSWVDEAAFPVHTVRYEDCLEDPQSAFGEAFRAVGLEISDERLQRAIESASFGNLRAQEEISDFAERVGESRFFRRGEAGSWRDELPPEQARQIEADHSAVMTRFGYL